VGAEEGRVVGVPAARAVAGAGVAVDLEAEADEVPRDHRVRVRLVERHRQAGRLGGLVHEVLGPRVAVFRFGGAVAALVAEAVVVRRAAVGPLERQVAPEALVDAAIAVVVDAVAHLGRARVNARIRVVAVGAVGHVPTRRRTRTLRAGRVAVAVAVAVAIPDRGDAFVDTAIAVVIDAVAGLGRAGVHARRRVVAIAGRHGVSIAVDVGLRGPLAGREAGRGAADLPTEGAVIRQLFAAAAVAPIHDVALAVRGGGARGTGVDATGIFHRTSVVDRPVAVVVDAVARFRRAGPDGVVVVVAVVGRVVAVGIGIRGAVAAREFAGAVAGVDAPGVAVRIDGRIAGVDHAGVARVGVAVRVRVGVRIGGAAGVGRPLIVVRKNAAGKHDQGHAQGEDGTHGASPRVVQSSFNAAVVT